MGFPLISLQSVKLHPSCAHNSFYFSLLAQKLTSYSLVTESVDKIEIENAKKCQVFHEGGMLVAARKCLHKFVNLRPICSCLV